MEKPGDNKDYPGLYEGTEFTSEWTDQLYARHVEVENLSKLEEQRGTPIPALFNQFYKFIQNPSSVSVETFKRMIDTDDTIGSGTDFLTTCLAARLGKYRHKSQEITEWVNKRIEEFDGGWTNYVKEHYSATWAGFYTGEKVWHNTEDGFVIKRIVPLPPQTVLFETERTGEITFDGILQYQRNYNPAVLSQGLGFFGGAIGTGFGFADNVRPDMFAKFGDLPFPMRTSNTFNYLSIRIPRIKCVHYAFDAQGKFGNPYGRSLLRRCYKYYVMKDTILQMLATALDRKGTAATIIYADQNTTLKDPTKVVPGKDQSGNRNVGISAQAAARDAFKNIHNDSFFVLPGKKGQIYDTDFMPQSSNANDFIASLDFCNKGIMRALLIPSLVFGSGDGSGSFALGQEHAKTFDKILDGMGAGGKQVLIQEIIKEMIAYNFPQSAWKKDGFGDFEKRELTQDERQKEAEMFTSGITDGYIDPQDLGDLNKMREVQGFTPRDTPIQQPVEAGGLFDDNGEGQGEEDGISGEREHTGDNEGAVGKNPQGGGKRSGQNKPGKEA